MTNDIALAVSGEVIKNLGDFVNANDLASKKNNDNGPLQSLATTAEVFVSYAWGDASSIASEEDRQRQEVVDWLCRSYQLSADC